MLLIMLIVYVLADDPAVQTFFLQKSVLIGYIESGDDLRCKHCGAKWSVSKWTFSSTLRADFSFNALTRLVRRNFHPCINMCEGIR